MRDDSALPRGFIINRRYEIAQFLGQGGFGITYAARDLSSGTIHALKEFFPADLAVRRSNGSVGMRPGKEQLFNKFLDGFVVETEHLSSFDHPNIVAVLSRFGANGTAYFAMEYLPGATLHDEVARQGPLPAPAVSLIGENLIAAVKTIHDQDVIHRDIKPGNIVLGDVVVARHTHVENVPHDQKLRYGMPVLLDFGAARVLRHDGRQMTMLASPKFAAPEQFDESARQDKRLDIYGLAATLYFCLSGAALPSAKERASGHKIEPAAVRFANRAPRRRLQAIDKALELDPAKRYQTIRDFREDFLSP